MYATSEKQHISAAVPAAYPPWTSPRAGFCAAVILAIGASLLITGIALNILKLSPAASICALILGTVFTGEGIAMLMFIIYNMKKHGLLDKKMDHSTTTNSNKKVFASYGFTLVQDPASTVDPIKPKLLRHAIGSVSLNSNTSIGSYALHNSKRSDGSETPVIASYLMYGREKSDENEKLLSIKVANEKGTKDTTRNFAYESRIIQTANQECFVLVRHIRSASPTIIRDVYELLCFSTIERMVSHVLNEPMIFYTHSSLLDPNSFTDVSFAKNGDLFVKWPSQDSSGDIYKKAKDCLEVISIDKLEKDNEGFPSLAVTKLIELWKNHL